MSAPSIIFDDVSKFYGEVLGVNRVRLTLAPGITGLVGPNGSGKTTLMNLMTGLLRPTHGRVSILGLDADRPEELFRRVGYATQFDSFPRALTGFELIAGYLGVHGYPTAEARERAALALAKVNLTEAGGRRVNGYSKGMRQRIKLAQAMAHDPDVLVLDEPLNGLDPMARAEVIALFQELAQAGKFVVVSSHILHEVDLISDRVVFLNSGYVLAEGEAHDVRSEMKEHPIQIFVRCERPETLAARLFAEDHVVEVKLHDDRRGLLVSTRDSDRFYQDLSRAVLEDGLPVEAVGPADEDVQAVYGYLIGGEVGRL